MRLPFPEPSPPEIHNDDVPRLMPIRPQFRYLYPIDWSQLSGVIRFERANGRCESCGRPHGREVHHLGDGTWYDEDRGQWISGRGRLLHRLAGRGLHATFRTNVVLATAHLDHDPTNNIGRNLKALCQRCHMLHDQLEHQRQRLMTLKQRKALGDLFTGPYTGRPAYLISVSAPGACAR